MSLATTRRGFGKLARSGWLAEFLAKHPSTTNRGITGEAVDELFSAGSVRLDDGRLMHHDHFVPKGSSCQVWFDPRRYRMDVKISPMRPTLQKNKQESWNPIHAITDNYIVVDKPPAIPTVPPRDLGNTGLIPHFLRQTLPRQIGHGSLLATSRLDAGTHGLVIVGRTREYVAAHNKLIRAREITKRYRCVVSGWDSSTHKLGEWKHLLTGRPDVKPLEPPQEGEFQIRDYAVDHSRLKRYAHHTTEDTSAEDVCLVIHSVNQVTPDSVALRPFNNDWLHSTNIQREMSEGRWKELDIELITGRTHQIRAQLKAEGVVIVGDWLYGSPFVPIGDTFALCCHSLEWRCPTTNSLLTYKLQDQEHQGGDLTIT